MRANVDILEKYIENLVIKKNLLQSSVEAYKLDINEYLSFLENKEKDIFNSNEDLFIEYFKEIEDKYSVASFKRKYSTTRNINIFEIEIKDLLKYNFEKIIVFRNSKIVTYEISAEISKELKEYYEKYAIEKRYLFGSYKKSSLISDLKRYNLDFKTLKNCLQEDEEEINKKIREIYFKIGIGDN